MAETPPPQTITLLPLLEALANRVLRARPAGGSLRLEALALEPEAVVLHVGVRNTPLPLEGTYRLRLTLLSTTPERTECALELPDLPGLGRLMGLGLKKMPRGRLVEELLARQLGEGMSLEGDRLVLEHATLVRRLLGSQDSDA